MMQILKHTSLCACFAAFSLMILSSPLQAQIAARSADVSGNLGFSNLSGSETVDGNKHLAFGGAGAYNFSDWGALDSSTATRCWVRRPRVELRYLDIFRATALSIAAI
jgi:hypothetical protein